MKFVFVLLLILSYSSAQSADSRCGSVVNNTLTSPGFPTQYPSKTHCVYNISIPSGKALKIGFSTFILESSARCRFDYLRISDDDNRALGTYCGRELSGKVVLVNGNYALITFRSDGSYQYQGFQLTISFAENQNAPRNIALFKATNQSSTYSDSYPASNAVDGDRGTQISKCTHTLKENNPWWRVDLGRAEPVAEVNIVNRDTLSARLDGAEIRVGNETTNRGASNRLCADNIRIPAASSNTYLCRHKSYGRYLYIRIPGRETFLTLCEVEVYSHPKLEILCGSVVNNTLKSPAKPDGVYAVSMKCIYNVSIPDGRVMRLKFQIFDLESDSGCRTDYLKITNGFEKGQYCGNQLMGRNLVVSGNYVVLTFHKVGRFERNKKDFEILFAQEIPTVFRETMKGFNRNLLEKRCGGFSNCFKKISNIT